VLAGGSRRRLVWPDASPEEQAPVLEVTQRLEDLTDEIVAFVDRDNDVTAKQVDDLHDRPQRVDTRPPVLNRDGPASVTKRGRRGLLAGRTASPSL
jgi:hypothetical protein